LSAEDFRHLAELQMLDLSQNQLTLVPDGAFEVLLKLKNLDLSSNQITHISAGSFSGLVQLERLYLHANQIQSIQTGAFESLHNLLELKLHGNLLTSLPTLSFSRLLLLDLSDNNIPTLEPSDLQTPHLEALKVSSLGLTSLDKNLFASLVNLHYLDISMNQLTAVPQAVQQDNMKGLIRLNLAGNPLGELKAEDFSRLNGLQELDLSGLNLQTENPFNCLCPLAWFSVWLQEKGVNLGRPEETRCHFPLVNAGKMLSELEFKDYGCLHTTTMGASAVTLVPRIWTTYRDGPRTYATPHGLQRDPSSVPPSVSAQTSGESEQCPGPCLNGGRCSVEDGQLGCRCPPGTAGVTCETKEDPLKSTNMPLVVPISSRHVTATSILLDLHRFIQTQPHIRGIRLTYRNLSGPDHRPIILRVPASYPEYTLRGLRPNCTYSVCASPLVERCRAQRRAQPGPSHPQEPRLTTPGPESGSLEPALAALVLLLGLAVLAGTVVCVRRRRRTKSGLELEGSSPECNVTVNLALARLLHFKVQIKTFMCRSPALPPHTLTSRSPASLQNWHETRFDPGLGLNQDKTRLKQD
uniref:Vasorin n=1 Tax=Neogobius melanostomus TaxID=47308 RepID=A0A8C6TA39_9GOBI